MDWFSKVNPMNMINVEVGKKFAEAIIKGLFEAGEHLNKVKKEVEAVFQRDHDLIGRVLKCHLILETYMDKCIKHLNRNQLAIDDTSLRFNQKIDLLEAKLDGIDSYFKGIRSLNTIRNKLAHNLHCEITLKDIQPMRPYVELYKREKLDDPIKIVEEFTVIACALLENATVDKFAGLSKVYASAAKMLEANPELYKDYFTKKPM